MPTETPLFSARDLRCVYGRGRDAVAAIDGIDFDIAKGEVISIVGESGAGKTTLAKIMLGLQRQTSGTLQFEGAAIPPSRIHCHKVQAVFQDPFASFNQFYTIKAQLRDTFNLFAQPPSAPEITQLIDHALHSVNLDPAKLDGKYPFELSGGQMQRLLLARIVLIRPQVLIADEPTSMVDACSRTQILDLLLGLQHELDMTIVFITHDIGLAHYVSDRIFIMFQGKIEEEGSPAQIFANPQKEYTRRLLDNIPRLRSPWLAKDRKANTP